MLQSTISKVALCAAGGAVAAMTAIGPAAAVSAAPALPDGGGGKVHKGWTTDRTDVHKRPSYDSRVISYIEAHRHIYLKCKVRKDGDTWYKLAKQHGWVNSDTVRTRSHVPHCRWGWGMNDSSMNDSSMDDSSMNDASTYPVDQTAGEPLG